MAGRLLAWALAGLLAAGLARAQTPPAGFESVFNGKDFTGWAGDLANYEVKDGNIVCKKGKGGVIFIQKEYGDFTARVNYKLPPGGNNGLAIRREEKRYMDDDDASRGYAPADPLYPA